MKEKMKVAAAQIAPVWLDREQTLVKVITYVREAASQGAAFVAFGEAFVPGYPFWVSLTDGARFESEAQKEMFALYSREAVHIEAGHLDKVCQAAKEAHIAVLLGIIERPSARAGHSLYCSLVMIGSDGAIQYVHRKLVPTYEERLVWSPGDGNGLQTYSMPPFTVGALNCWENWMPLTRTALYAQGVDFHVALWPGGLHNTHDITRHIAKEGRCFVMSVNGILRKKDIGSHIPLAERMFEQEEDFFANGGSCIAGPDGEWLMEPLGHEEGLIYATIDHEAVRKSRQNFDPTGHYSRPDVLSLNLNAERQSVLKRI